MTAAPLVAVEVGASATRIAATGPDGRPEPVVTLPAGTTAAESLVALFGDGPVAALAVVDGVDEHDVLAVPGTLAVRAAAGSGAGTCLVVDAGAGGTGLGVVAGDRVESVERVPLGGHALDAVVAAGTGLGAADARAVREALSVRAAVRTPDGGTVEATVVGALLRPVLEEVAERVRDVVARSGAEEVVLAGGLARTPLLAGLLDAAVDVPVYLVEAPESAAVRGALGMLADRASARRPVGVRPDGGSDPPVDPGDLVDALGRTSRPDRSARTAGPRWRRRLRAAVVPAVAAAGLVLVAAGAVTGRAPATPEPAGRVLVQYGYTATLPEGWEHTGGLPGRRRTLLTRTGSPDGAELIALERSPLGYDGAVEPDRARTELRAEHGRRAGPDRLTGLRDDVVRGRAVTRYRQDGPGPAVDWFVVFAGTDQLVVGCRHPEAPVVAVACAAVVASVRPAG